MRGLAVLAVLLGVCGLVCGGAGADAEEGRFFGKRCRLLESDHFRLVHDMRRREAEGLAAVLEFGYGEFESRLKGYGLSFRTPEERLAWLCFSDLGAFVDYALETEGADLSRLTGYYSSRTNRVAVVKPDRVARWGRLRKAAAEGAGEAGRRTDEGLVQVVHESAHQLAFNTGLQKRGVMYPLWAAEGVALIFEDCASRYTGCVGYSEGRKRRLLELYEQAELVGLEEFVGLARVPGGRAEADIYAQIWGFFVFLCEKRPDELKGYFSYVHSLEPGRRSGRHLRREFVELFGAVEEIDRQWVGFLKSLVIERAVVRAESPASR